MLQPEQQENSLSKVVIQHSYAGDILEGYPWETMQVFYDRLAM
jgi:hypothetical protein